MNSRVTVKSQAVGAVAHQATGVHEVSNRKDRGQPMFCCQFGDASTVHYEKGLDCCEESFGAGLCCGSDCGREIVACRDALVLQPKPHRAGGFFQLLHLQRPDRVGQVRQYRHQ